MADGTVGRILSGVLMLNREIPLANSRKYCRFAIEDIVFTF